MLQGVFPVIPTLFAEDGSPDHESQRKVIQFALKSGAHGIVFPGVASEYNFLTPEERGDLIALTAEAVNGKVPIVGGASAATPEEVIAAGLQAKAHDINHLMVMAPSCLGKNVEDHHAFFEQITKEIGEPQIILQNAPDPVGAGLDAESIIDIARNNSCIAYVKEETLPSGPAITAIREANIPHLKAVFGGGGSRYMIDELQRGALGAMPAVELTDLHVALFNAWTNDDKDKARNLYRLSLPLLVCQTIYRMRLTKYVLSKRGIAHALHVRAPLPEMDDYTKRDIEQMLADLPDSFV